MVLGIDTGYGMTKTKNFVFASGVAHLNTAPPLLERVLEFKGSFYQIGNVPDGITNDKTKDNDYYLLVLAACAMELKKLNLYSATITLAVGTPLMRLGEERDKLIEYLLQDREVVFKYEGAEYHIVFDGKVFVYPQGYSAIVSKMRDIKGSCYLIDIGTGTTEILPIASNHTVNLGKAFTLQNGISDCIKDIKGVISDKFNSKLMGEEYIDILRGIYDNEMVLEVCKPVIINFVRECLKLLNQNEVNYQLTPTFIVGGGAGIIKRYIDEVDAGIHNITFIDDVRANAVGYETLAKAELSSR
jgi:plasmid segregation protein ParM